MSDNEYPEYSEDAALGNRGRRIVETVIHDTFNWLFREIPKDDLGIDAFVELLRDDRKSCGRLFAIQIKCGQSYFAESNDEGFIYRGELKHLNYWSGYALPVLIVLCDPSTEMCYWAHVVSTDVTRTSAGWKLLVPRSQTLTAIHRPQLEGITQANISGPNNQKDIANWWTVNVGGTAFQLECGIAGTAHIPNGHHPSWFPFESTIILGDSGKGNPKNPASQTLARWRIPTDPFPIQLYTRGYLLVACLRRFGGLHSPTFKDRVELTLNGSVLDGFELQYAPKGHRDYFHQIPFPNVPKLFPFSDCEMVYSWPVPKSHLRLQADQELVIRLDGDTKWDIDFLGFLFELPEDRPQVFISHNSNDKQLARRLAKDLKTRGIGVWIDEAEIKLGDSLLKKIQEGIRVVGYVLVILSRNSIDSRWVNTELEIAMNQEISVVS